MSLLSIFEIAGLSAERAVPAHERVGQQHGQRRQRGRPRRPAIPARQVVFQVNPPPSQAFGQEIGGVRVAGVVEDQSPFKKIHDPKHPMADAQGYVNMPNVDPVAETVNNMIAASRSYQANVEVLNTAKQLMLKTLTIGQS